MVTSATMIGGCRAMRGVRNPMLLLLVVVLLDWLSYWWLGLWLDTSTALVGVEIPGR